MLTRESLSAYADAMETRAQIAESAASADPEVGLRAVAALRVLTEELEALQVDRARRAGWSWQDIAAGLGCEHLLYAIAHSPTPVGEVARTHGVTPDRVAAQTERLLNGPRGVFAGLDAEALATIGIDLQAVRDAVEANLGPLPAPRPRT